MGLYQKGVAEGGFESGIRLALEGILASPRFVFRFEERPAAARAGEAYALNDFDLASRLSFFLWASAPDEPLRKLAASGRLSAPGMLEQQVKRMLADPRSEVLASRFASQWLRLQDLDKLNPDVRFYPDFDEQLKSAMRRETELFFANLVREDRSVLDLFTADYTFVNERLARHYRIPGVVGSQFRKVTYPDDRRGGLLGQGSVLTLTSHADRTSPVLRGKWVMEVLLGTPPPAPPPNVPDLDATPDAEDGRLRTVRQRMEQHRANPACNSCHRMIDPIGLALDNFDVTGAWRIRDNGMPVDAASTLYDGTAADGPGRSAPRAAVAHRRAGADLRREPDDLRAGPAAVGVGHAGRARARAPGRGGRSSALVVHPGHRPHAGVPDEGCGGRGDGRAGTVGGSDRCPVSGVRVRSRAIGGLSSRPRRGPETGFRVPEAARRP